MARNQGFTSSQSQPSPVQALLNKAIAHHQAGRLAEAERLYVQILERNSKHADASHLLGLISYQVGDLNSATALISKAIKVNGNVAPFHFSLGNVLISAGRMNEAAEAYARVLALDPRSPEAHNNLGVILLKQGKLDEAKTHFEQALALQPEYADAHNNLGMALKDKGLFKEAANYFNRALLLKPDYVEALNNLGIVLRALEDFDGAIANYEKALALRPGYVEAYSNLGNALRDKGMFEVSERHFEQALALNPGHAEAHSNLGNALKDQGRIEEALARYQKAIVLKPDFAVAHFNLGTVHQEIGNFAEAMKYYDQAIALEPEYADAHWNQALIMLTRGDFADGWRKYEWRWRTKEPGMHPFAKPLWDGSRLDGKTILLHCEQGLGDNLQFIRYAPMVKERGGRVVLACTETLIRLFGAVNGIDEIFPIRGSLPPYDVQSPLLSLPMIFGTTLETIPAQTPYLAAPPEGVEKWAQRLAPYDGLKVGLVWAGNPRKDRAGAHAVDRRRSMSLEHFAPLASVPGLHWFSLQKGEPAQQGRTPPAGMELIDFMIDVNDFADTAALIANLDLVIGVDTSVIHMSGALAKPTWVLSRFDGCWRWLLQREDNPWYPGMRLFRQQAPAAWAPVVEQVRAALAEWTGS